MEFQQLRNLLCVAEYQNISRAARELLISQPALSRSIHALETDLGVILLERSSSGVTLTQQGEVLVQRARDMLAMESCIKQEVTQSLEHQRPPLRLIYRCCEQFLTEILQIYQEKDPDLSFAILQNDDIALQNHQCDLIVAGVLMDELGYLRTRLLTERLLCAIPTNHPYATQSMLRLEQYASLPQVQFGGHRQIQRTIKKHLALHGLNLPVAIECDDVSTGCDLVAHGFGVLLVPEYARRVSTMEGVRLMPVQGVDITREVYLYRRANTYLPTYIENFANFLVSFFKKQEKK